MASHASHRLVTAPNLWPSRIRTVAATIACVAILTAMAIDLELMPDRLFSGLGQVGKMFGSAFPPHPGGQFPRILRGLGETFAMAFAGTVIAVAVAIPLGLIGAKTIVPEPAVHFLIRRFLDLFRGVPALVWALILVSLFGLAPIDIHRSQIIAAARCTKPAKWMVRRS